MLETALPGSRRITLGGDKGYDTRDFVASCRALKVTPHIARNEGRAGGSALDRRTARHPWLRGEPKGTQASRRDLRLDEDRRRICAVPAIAASIAPNCMPIWWPPLTICSESPDSARHQREP